VASREATVPHGWPVNVKPAIHLRISSGEVEAIKAHDLVPRGHEVLDERFLCVVARVDLGDRPDLVVCLEDDVDRGGRPFDLAACAVATLLHLRGRSVERRTRLPLFGAHSTGCAQEVRARPRCASVPSRAQ